MAATEAVRDVKCMLACLLRMHMSNDAVVFWNHSREFKIMLRNDPVDSSTVSFELAIVPEDEDEEDGTVAKVLELEYDGVDDEGLFVVESYSFDMEAVVRHPEDLDDARRRLNALCLYTVCGCGAYFIKDGARTCLHCQLTADRHDAPLHFCAICHEQSIERHMVRQPCCKQLLHRACLATWEAKSADAQCPLCRT